MFAHLCFVDLVACRGAAEQADVEAVLVEALPDGIHGGLALLHQVLDDLDLADLRDLCPHQLYIK